MLFVMRNALFLISALALFVTGFVSLVDAHVDGQGFGLHIESTQDIGEEKDSDEANAFYDVPSFSVDDSEMSALASETPVSFFDYIQKRPPRI